MTSHRGRDADLIAQDEYASCQPAPKWTPWTPWPSACLEVPQLDSTGPLPTRGHGTGHVHAAKRRRVHRGTSGDHSGGNS